VARGEGHGSLPIVMLPHPIGEADMGKVAQKGTEAAAECVRLLTTPGETVGREYAAKKFPLPEHAVPRG
jgi:predicted dienelactone hydrolase